jgi:hypothetical protein
MFIKLIPFHPVSGYPDEYWPSWQSPRAAQQYSIWGAEGELSQSLELRVQCIYFLHYNIYMFIIFIIFIIIFIIFIIR